MSTDEDAKDEVNAAMCGGSVGLNPVKSPTGENWSKGDDAVVFKGVVAIAEAGFSESGVLSTDPNLSAISSFPAIVAVACPSKSIECCSKDPETDLLVMPLDNSPA